MVDRLHELGGKETRDIHSIPDIVAKEKQAYVPVEGILKATEKFASELTNIACAFKDSVSSSDRDDLFRQAVSFAQQVAFL